MKSESKGENAAFWSQIAAGYEDCNDADHLRIDPALRLALKRDFKGSDSEVLSKCTVKRCSSRFWGGLIVFWLFQEQISVLNKGKLVKNWQTRLWNLPLGTVAA